MLEVVPTHEAESPLAEQHPHPPFGHLLPEGEGIRASLILLPPGEGGAQRRMKVLLCLRRNEAQSEAVL